MCSRYASKASTYTDDSLLASCRQVATLPSPAQSRHPENRKPKFYRLELAALQVTHISVLETGRLFVGLRETEGSQPLHADSSARNADAPANHLADGGEAVLHDGKQASSTEKQSGSRSALSDT